MDTRTRPANYEFLAPATLLIEWQDGHTSLYPHRLLRERCECAACVDEWTRRPILDPKTLPDDIHVTACEPTGHYGLNLHFSDRHQTGIYSFRALRHVCPCPECAAEQAAGPSSSPSSSSASSSPSASSTPTPPSGPADAPGKEAR